MRTLLVCLFFASFALADDPRVSIWRNHQPPTPRDALMVTVDLPSKYKAIRVEVTYGTETWKSPLKFVYDISNDGKVYRYRGTKDGPEKWPTGEKVNVTVVVEKDGKEIEIVLHKVKIDVTH